MGEAFDLEQRTTRSNEIQSGSRLSMYDAIIIGAGHNGLVTAAYLAKSGKRVIVLERRGITGGTLVSETFGEGFKVDAVHAGGMLRPDIIKDLKLDLLGYPAVARKTARVSLLSRNERLILDPDPVRAAEAIKHLSEGDARRWPDFVEYMEKSSRFLEVLYATIMPRLPRNFSLAEGYGLAELLLELRLMGRKEMLAFIRMLPMSAVEFLEEWFESEAVKVALASLAIHGVTLGVMSAGTAYNLLHNWFVRGGLTYQNPGKAGNISDALASAVTAYGGEIRTHSEVESILIDTYTCKGVRLVNGEEIHADLVVSALDPRRTFLKLAGAINLPPEFVWNVQSIKMRGSVAKVHFLLERPLGRLESNSKAREQTEPHTSLFGIASSINQLERAYDSAKYGQISEQPYMEFTTSANTVSAHMQYAPYALKIGSWIAGRKTLEELVVNTLEEYFPNFKSSIRQIISLTPADLEETYGLTEGEINHGQLMLDQQLFMRPIPGWSNHKTPLDGLYLCGSGVHAGGGVSGASGRNAAVVILRDKARYRIG